MTITLFGASGAIGSLLLKRFLESGDTVYVYVRNLDKTILEGANLHLIEGELDNECAIEKAIAPADVVISTLGPSMKGNRNDRRTPIADGHELIIRVMERLDKRQFYSPNAHCFQ